MWIVGPLLALGLTWAMTEDVAQFRIAETEGRTALVEAWSKLFYDLGGIEGVVVGHVLFVCLVLVSAGLLGWRGFKPRQFGKPKGD